MSELWQIRTHNRGPKDAPAILLLHGFLGSHRDWDPLAASLAPHYRVIVPDLPGHGDSPFLAPASAGLIPRLADDLVRLLPRLGHHAIVGYSMGGRIALHCLLRHPKRFAFAFLESAGLGLLDDPARIQRREWESKLAERLVQQAPRDFLSDWYRLPIFASLADRPALLAELLEARAQNDPAQLAMALVAFSVADQDDHRPSLPSLSMPLHFIAGKLDPKYMALAIEAAALCPLGNTHLLCDCGHTPHVESPELFNQLILDTIEFYSR